MIQNFRCLNLVQINPFPEFCVQGKCSDTAGCSLYLCSQKAVLTVLGNSSHRKKKRKKKRTKKREVDDEKETFHSITTIKLCMKKSQTENRVINQTGGTRRSLVCRVDWPWTM